MKKKVAELQQRKKELQQKQKQQKETNKTSTSSISEDLKGIDLSSTNSETPIITVHNTCTVFTCSVTVIHVRVSVHVTLHLV